LALARKDSNLFTTYLHLHHIVKAMHGLKIEMKAKFLITSFSAGPTGPSSGTPGKKMEGAA
jgi:hypothetical protein